MPYSIISSSRCTSRCKWTFNWRNYHIFNARCIGLKDRWALLEDTSHAIPTTGFIASRVVGITIPLNATRRISNDRSCFCLYRSHKDGVRVVSVREALLSWMVVASRSSQISYWRYSSTKSRWLRSRFTEIQVILREQFRWQARECVVKFLRPHC